MCVISQIFHLSAADLGDEQIVDNPRPKDGEASPQGLPQLPQVEGDNRSPLTHLIGQFFEDLGKPMNKARLILTCMYMGRFFRSKITVLETYINVHIQDAKTAGGHKF